MLINSLEQMDKIVDNNPNLSWKGWDVVEMAFDPMAFTKLNAAFVDGKWVRIKTYPITEQGWEIPLKFVR